jgi:Leucine-rich repeat (LRR) protein
MTVFSSEVNCSISMASYEALESLYDATAGRYWLWDQQLPSSTVWQFPSPLTAPCTDAWQGLTCSLLTSSSTTCKITAVSLTSYNLTGTIPSELGLLSSIQALELGQNQLKGSLASEIGNLENAVELLLYENLLTGIIPSELGQLSNVEILALCNNSLTGIIPPELGALVNLEELAFFNNSMDGTLPTELGSLTKLLVLNLFYNSFDGTIPSELGQLSSLEILSLYENSLEGTIPSEIGSLTNLTLVALFYNFLSGTVPVEFGNLAIVQSIGLDNNMLSGTISPELGNLDTLETLALNYNFLDGSVPAELGYLENLQVLYLLENCLTGTIPSELGNLTNLYVLSLYANSLVGPLPHELGSLPNLQELYLSDNSLDGLFELSAFDGPLIMALNVSDNAFTGSIKLVAEKNSLQLLQVLDMSKNRFSGTLDDSLFALPSLKTVVLSQNCLSGSLPASLCTGGNLTNVILDLLTANCERAGGGIVQGLVLHQYMRGSIPACVWNSTSIRTLLLLGNGLKGSVEDLATESQLSVLALGSNQLTGTLPISFQHHSFDQLDLSINRLTGTLESSLFVNQTAAVYDLSVNRLSGEVPPAFYGDFGTNVINILKGNLFGCKQTDIPASDVDHASYQCGSLDLEYALLLWFVGAGVVVLAAVVAHFLGYRWLNQGFNGSELPELFYAPVRYLTISMVGLLGFITIKLGAKRTASTYAVQYWWTTTVGYAHDWPISLFLFVMLAASATVFTVMITTRLSKGLELIAEGPTRAFATTVTLQRICAHLINVVVVTAVNAVYVLIAVGSVSGASLIAVQAGLGLFKLVWSTIVIPWLLFVAVKESSLQLSHYTFMILFVFLGAPFTSSFSESSSCFLYVLKKPSSLSFSFVIPTVEFSGTCNPAGCTLLPQTIDQVFQGSILSPWIYSFQCSSAVVANYAPVLVLSYLMSGVVLPVSQLLIASNQSLGFLSVLPIIPFKITAAEKEAAQVLLKRISVSRLATKMTVKYILNFAVMLTFGLAVPLLAVTVVFDTLLNMATTLVLLQKYIAICEQSETATEYVKQEFWNSFRMDSRQARRCCYIVLGYVSLFWSLFAFDWIGDVYGTVAGGLAMMVPLIMPTLIALITLRNRPSEKVATLRQESDNLELGKIIINPVILPQTASDDFSASVLTR